MNHANRGFGLVNVLAARTARFERFDPQLFRLDLDPKTFAVGNLRDHVDSSERRMAAMRGIEWREPHQSMDAALALEHAVRVAAAHKKDYGLQACLFGRRLVNDLRREALGFGPAKVHSGEHRGPVGCIYTAGSGENAYDSVVRVELAAETG